MRVAGLRRYYALLLTVGNRLKLVQMRDTETTRENYIALAITTGIQRNRKKLWLMRSDIVAIARLSDVVET